MWALVKQTVEDHLQDSGMYKVMSAMKALRLHECEHVSSWEQGSL